MRVSRSDILAVIVCSSYLQPDTLILISSPYSRPPLTPTNISCNATVHVDDHDVRGCVSLEQACCEKLLLAVTIMMISKRCLLSIFYDVQPL